MAEMPDVIAGEVIETDWGNDLRDRSMQRYASSAARAASVTSPVNGDFSFLTDTGLAYVYFGGAWIPVGGPESVDGSANLSASLTGSYANVANTVSLTIPTQWDQWSCFVTASWKPTAASGTTYDIRFSIDGTTSSEMTTLDADASSRPAGHSGRRTGMTTTGARTIALQGKENGATNVALLEGFIYARATRTA